MNILNSYRHYNCHIRNIFYKCKRYWQKMFNEVNSSENILNNVMEELEHYVNHLLDKENESVIDNDIMLIYRWWQRHKIKLKELNEELLRIELGIVKLDEGYFDNIQYRQQILYKDETTMLIKTIELRKHMW